MSNFSLFFELHYSLTLSSNNGMKPKKVKLRIITKLQNHCFHLNYSMTEMDIVFATSGCQMKY